MGLRPRKIVDAHACHAGEWASLVKSVSRKEERTIYDREQVINERHSTWMSDTGLEQLLFRCGHRVRLAGNGQEALALAEEERFNLLLQDMRTLELEGFRGFHTIREREGNAGGHLPVIVLTTRSKEEDRERCLAAGMDDFLPKPVRAADLWAAIDRVVVTRQPTEPSESELLDRHLLWKLCGADPAVLDKIVNVFQTRVPGHLAAVQDALRDQDSPRLREAIQKLRGMVGVLSTVAGSLASDNVDHAARGQLVEARPLVERTRTVSQMRTVMSLAAS